MNSAFTCKFEFAMEWSLGYTCEFESISFLDETEDFLIEGEHLNGLGDEDVLTVTMTSSNVSHLPKEVFEKFVNLTHLFVRQSRMESIEGAFVLCDKLETATFAQNNLKQIESRAFEKCSSLTFLDFSDNQISIIPVDAFEGLSNLETLTLSNNPITNILPGTFDMMTNLWLLRMLDLEVSELNPQLFRSLTSLNTLEFGSKLPQDVFTMQTGTFKSLPLLQEIKIKNSNKETTRIDSGAFEDLENLIYLDLSACAIQRLDTNAFMNVPNLMHLNIRDNQMTEIEETFFTNLPGLKEVLATRNRCVNDTYYIDSPFDGSFLQEMNECFRNYDNSMTTEMETTSTTRTTTTTTSTTTLTTASPTTTPPTTTILTTTPPTINSTPTTEETADTTLGASAIFPTFLIVTGFAGICFFLSSLQ